MALIQATSRVLAGDVAWRLTAPGGESEDLTVGANIILVSHTHPAIFGIESGHDVTIAGLVTGGLNAVWLGDNLTQDSAQTVKVVAGGRVSSSLSALYSAAILVQAHDSLIENAGTLSGDYGVHFGGVGTGESRFVNTGFIYAGNAGVFVSASATEDIFIKNSGRIVAHNEVLSAGLAGGDITFINTGLVIGKQLFLGAGNDLYDGRLGRAASATPGDVNGILILGGGGDDAFIPGLSKEWLEGGVGRDMVDFSLSASGITAALDGAYRGTGFARGDTYVLIENLKGSLKGADILRGDGGANTLYGQGGADRLEGAAGHDTLIGGTGVDRLTGEDGNDVFLFNALNEIGDRITDFKNNAYGDDAIHISRTGFGLSALPNGVLDPAFFRVSATNAAEDGNDIFIFRTTDKTLWFDGDGNGARKPVLVADLQASAILGAGDIFIVN